MSTRSAWLRRPDLFRESRWQPIDLGMAVSTPQRLRLACLRAVLPVSLLVSLLALALALPAVGDDGQREQGDEGWELMKDENGIRSYRRLVEGSPFLAFKGECVIAAPVDRVMSVVLDSTRVDEWMSNIDESKMIGWTEDSEEYVQYSKFDLPWPISDRVFVSRVRLTVDPESYSTTLDYSNSDVAIEPTNAIRGTVSGTHYRLEPIEGGRKTLFTGIARADPKGYIPAWLINWLGTGWPQKTLTALRDQVQRDDIEVIARVESLYRGFEVESAALAVD
jgi:hypothetical protein